MAIAAIVIAAIAISAMAVAAIAVAAVVFGEPCQLSPWLKTSFYKL
jgi:hypothetical protein